MKALVVMGSSLGGMSSIRTVLTGIPADFPAPLAIVQHRQAERESNLLDLLRPSCALELREPDDRDPIQCGHVYVAPAGYHLMIEGDCFALSTDEPVAFARPSIDVLFETAADSYGPNVASVLLGISSEDGAAGSAAVARAGGTTILQDPKTASSDVAIIAAKALHEPTHVVPIERIASVLCSWCDGRSDERSGGVR